MDQEALIGSLHLIFSCIQPQFIECFFYLCIYSFVIFQRTQHICIVNTCNEMPSSPSALASWSITILKNAGDTRIHLISNYGIFLMEMNPSFLKKQLFKCYDKHPSYFGFFLLLQYNILSLFWRNYFGHTAIW